MLPNDSPLSKPAERLREINLRRQINHDLAQANKQATSAKTQYVKNHLIFSLTEFRLLLDLEEIKEKGWVCITNNGLVLKERLQVVGEPLPVQRNQK
jgi:hypothetical protein